MPLTLEIITPERVVMSEPVDFVSVRGTAGELGVLPGHSPLFTKLEIDLLSFQQGNKQDVVAVMGGFMDVHPDRVTILSDAAERASEIDELRARQAKERAEVQAGMVKDVQAEVALQKALIRLRAVEVLRVGSYRR